MLRNVRTVLADTRGVVAMEFALVLPLMIPLLFVGYEIAQYVRATMQLQSATVAMADLIAQQSAGVSAGGWSSLGNFCSAGQMMMTPFPPDSLAVAMASVSNSAGTAQLDWEDDNECWVTSAPLGGKAIDLATTPKNLIPNAGTPGDSVIVVQATYQYRSLLKYLLPIPITITQTAFARPRGNAPIACNGC